MDDKLFTYAVARIRSKELTLFDKQDLDQLLASKSYNDALRFLNEKGWGTSGNETAEQLLAEQREETWKLIHELVDKEDMDVFNIFLYSNDFHNLKAAIKQAYVSKDVPNIFIKNGTVDPMLILESAREHDFIKLPAFLAKCAEEAYEVMFHTGDGQLCDVIIDRAALEAIHARAFETDNELIRDYAELKCAAANINIAIRAQRTQKSYEFLERAFVECATLNRKRLVEATLNSEEAIYEYLETTVYSDAIEAIKESPSAFDRWCDNRLINQVRPQKYNAFTISPLLAYVIAKENEIKSVRIILSGKLNSLPEDKIRERLRDMYV
ncbi:V-type ATPase subunit [Parasporobacterium paucivorans]|uniref:V/A-type H+-transporting ATPase subunit C n=1 Tax=Parasporobacterium paucivorans DSM 15970 TaxID=1122934 RepID=A0A1M6CR05_9FIRM|nr:V-type ATPase subunit [Parasporobacterium paucivorans]SHI63224.1 V/A-type H+-transporting ATPase subunit C [Parasporobacterium paucivorans DSM 15970]